MGRRDRCFPSTSNLPYDAPGQFSSHSWPTQPPQPPRIKQRGGGDKDKNSITMTMPGRLSPLNLEQDRLGCLEWWSHLQSATEVLSSEQQFSMGPLVPAASPEKYPLKSWHKCMFLGPASTHPAPNYERVPITCFKKSCRFWFEPKFDYHSGVLAVGAKRADVKP